MGNAAVLLSVHELGDSHDVLGEGSGLVGADARGGAEGLDTLEVFYEDLREVKGRDM